MMSMSKSEERRIDTIFVYHSLNFDMDTISYRHCQCQSPGGTLGEDSVPAVQALADVHASMTHQIDSLAYEKFTSGELTNRELEEIYDTLRQWSALQNEIVRLLRGIFEGSFTTNSEEFCNDRHQ